MTKCRGGAGLTNLTATKSTRARSRTAGPAVTRRSLSPWPSILKLPLPTPAARRTMGRRKRARSSPSGVTGLSALSCAAQRATHACRGRASEELVCRLAAVGLQAKLRHEDKVRMGAAADEGVAATRAHGRLIFRRQT